ncbi:SRPBCC family protein [Intrasporangium calvum]|uniref:SRPBCC family protein n=1 Tax=Intrasporangium calvum TaxID=53358 RepID=A0ABT5GK70_9MICO|nr:SRPBCC family protein [Intrasporangium calvum]MDC5698275.1 SRPBCC family protein [Intrasporangium calvum]
MSRTTRFMNCAPEDVFEILADGWSFASWVVGAARIREVDDTWPQPGSRIHHSVGLWPVLIDDSTSVLTLDRPYAIELKVRAWPTGEGKVRLECIAEEGGTRVVMTEDATNGPATLIPRLVRDPMLDARNVEALRRLAFLAERKAAEPRAAKRVEES